MANEFVLYRGEKFYLQTTGRYYQSGDKTADERLLHRRIWVEHYGPIPDGFEIHHRDENWRDSAIGNLESKPTTEHRREHMLARMADPEFRARAIGALRAASPLAAEWHASEAGRAWHSRNSLQAWAKRGPLQVACERCGATFEAMMSDARFCSHACEQRGSYGRQRTLPATCVHCNTEFLANRYRPPACCSKTCAARRRRGHPPEPLG